MDELHDDDRPVGRVLTRREVLALFGSTGAAMAVVACSPSAVGSTAASAGAPSVVSPGSSPSPAASSSTAASAAPSAAASTAVPACIVKPELTEGPFFVDERLDRSDIRADTSDGSISAGTELGLTFLVSKVEGTACTALAGALVDVWHCDAAGLYSDVSDRSADTRGQDFLRGYQLTDSSGTATFTTVYPGWYQGRTVHIHFKIRTDPDSSSGLEFTSQLFFDDDLTDEVFTADPYASKGERTLRNDGDGIFLQSGDQLTLACTPSGSGYAATFEIGVQTA